MIEEPIEPTPPRVGYTRRRRRRPPPPPQHQIARNDDTIFTFFSTLFDRPARRQYLHSFNQNATNLVRRLSQSRLFINRSNSGHSPVVTPSTPMPSMAVNDDERIERNASSAPFATSSLNLDVDDDVYEQIMVRTETPPPPYVDVAVKKRISL